MLIENFDHTIDFWIKELEKYDFMELCTQPSSNNWSLGQVYMHLIENTEWFLEQVTISANTNDHEMEDASPAAREMFLNNNFPNAVMEGPPENANTPQPKSKEQILTDLMKLKAEIYTVGKLISETKFKGKTKHPGLRYFSASQWFQFAEMHFRHHLRQKTRIDNFLKTNRHAHIF
jgi:hypothetical protein